MQIHKYIYAFFFLVVLSIHSPAIGEETRPEKVLICGVCKDVASRLPYTIKIIEKIGSLFADYRVLVYENSSSDKTPLLLQEWMKKNNRIEAVCEDISYKDLQEMAINLLDKDVPFRPEMISRARNLVLDRAMDPMFADFPYIIWLDMDFKIPPRFEGFTEVFASDKEWDAVFAYGIDPSKQHWDWYAFRDPILYPLGSELLGDYWWKMYKFFSLTLSDDWYPVYSAFGGCGIYKKSSIEGCRYSATVTPDLESVSKMVLKEQLAKNHPLALLYEATISSLNSIELIPSCFPGLKKIKDPMVGILLQENPSALIWKMSSAVYQYPSVCEHVPFHASMIMRGKNKLFIHPGLIFTYGG